MKLQVCIKCYADIYWQWGNMSFINMKVVSVKKNIFCVIIQKEEGQLFLNVCNLYLIMQSHLD